MTVPLNRPELVGGANTLKIKLTNQKKYRLSLLMLEPPLKETGLRKPSVQI
jgi:hypothetical protein